MMVQQINLHPSTSIHQDFRRAAANGRGTTKDSRKAMAKRRPRARKRAMTSGSRGSSLANGCTWIMGFSAANRCKKVGIPWDFHGISR